MGDQDVAMLEDRGVVLLPLVSTVTYCCDGGAPVVVLTKPTLDAGPEGLEGMHLMPFDDDDDVVDTFIVYPSHGRHVAFRGTLLHGCPPKLEERCVERIAVLVNIWIHHEPFDLRQLRPPLKLPSENLRGNRRAEASVYLKPNIQVAASRVQLKKE